MTTQVEQKTIEQELDLLDSALLEITRTELRKKVTVRRSGLVDSLFDAGVDTIYAVYEHLHNPAQGLGGYSTALIGILGDDGKDECIALANAMNEAARASGREEIYTPEHAAQSACKGLDGLLFQFESSALAEDKPEAYRMIGSDVWALRVRHAIEVKTGFVKSQEKRKSIGRAVKQFGYSALAEARQKYFGK